MVTKITHHFNNIFDRILITKQKIIRSSGLLFVMKHMSDSGITASLLEKLKDARVTGKVKFPISEIVTRIILHLLDGDKRISHFANNPNLELFKKIFSKEAPHPTVILNAFKANKLLKVALDKVLLRMALKSLIEHCKAQNINEIIIDTDQSAREIYGKQENVTAGYFARKPKNTKGFQFRLWTVRNLKIILKIDLMPGSAHSKTNVSSDFRLLMKTLKKAGITALFVGDSGFFSAAICEMIESNGQKFIFAVAQHKTVKKRGKYAKNKRTIQDGQIVIKERFRPMSKKTENRFREIFIQVGYCDGQLRFDFASDEFTNVIITNLSHSAEDVYATYRGHAVIETIIEELKNDFGTGIAHSSYFFVNSAMTTITGLAYNIKNNFLDSYNLRYRQNERIKLSTLQNSWLHIPGIISKSGNRDTIRVSVDGYKKLRTLKNAA